MDQSRIGGFVISGISAFIAAFLSAFFIMLVDKLLSRRKERRDGNIERHNAEVDKLKVAKKWAYRSCILLSEDMEILKNILAKDFFIGIGKNSEVNVSATFPAEIKEMDFDEIDTVNSSLQIAFVNLGQSVFSLNNALIGFRENYYRVVALCYSDTQTLIKDATFRSNTNRDFRKMEEKLYKKMDALRIEVIKLVYMIDGYFTGILKLKYRDEPWWSDFDEIMEKKANINISMEKVDEQVKAFMENGSEEIEQKTPDVRWTRERS